MKHYGVRTALTASTLALSLALAPASMAKPKQQAQSQPTTTVSGGTSGGVTGRDVSVNTSGTGTSTLGPDGQATGVSGTADATAENGTVTTRIDGKTTDQRARLRSVATAQTEEEKARSRTMTKVSPNQTIRSRTTTRYKMDGEKVVKDTVTTIVCADGRTVDKMKGCMTK